MTRNASKVISKITTLAKRQEPACYSHVLGVVRARYVAHQIQLSETAPWVFKDCGKLSKASGQFQDENTNPASFGSA